MTKNPQFHGRVKHIDINISIRQQVTQGTIELQYCPTAEMVADKLTKDLHSCETSCKLRDMSAWIDGILMIIK